MSAVSADATPAYDRLATLSVAGANLDLGITANATGCSGAAVLSGGTATSVKVTCTLDRDGDISLSPLSVSGAVLKTASFVVPKPQVKVATSLGSLVIELEQAKVPITGKNFLDYVQDGHFENTVFHPI